MGRGEFQSGDISSKLVAINFDLVAFPQNWPRSILILWRFLKIGRDQF